MNFFQLKEVIEIKKSFDCVPCIKPFIFPRTQLILFIFEMSRYSNSRLFILTIGLISSVKFSSSTHLLFDGLAVKKSLNLFLAVESRGTTIAIDDDIMCVQAIILSTLPVSFLPSTSSPVAFYSRKTIQSNKTMIAVFYTGIRNLRDRNQQKSYQCGVSLMFKLILLENNSFHLFHESFNWRFYTSRQIVDWTSWFCSSDWILDRQKLQKSAFNF